MLHYTDDAGFKAINAQPVLVFKAAKPPGGHPYGAYFTTLDPTTKNLAKRLRLPKSKMSFVFSFFYSPGDYRVEKSRQSDSGSLEEMKERHP